ncbi:hypothetical protein [Pseudomonas abietaniphila]|jgi:hypothetical protein|uniref:hypothetical protein n=1 Tax=Pseudomonas abietaniphila TaxID=89065 RepID=UPI000783D72C|nr:hypothetical protein [Pseudomonas abietaniphila]
MFRTQQTDLAGVPGMFGEGLAHWHAISRVLRTHWYHVTVRMALEGRHTEVELMINDEQRLGSALASQDSSTRITDVQVVTPAYMNGGEGWRMEPLTSLLMGDDEHECSVCLIEVEGGAVYHSSHSKDFDQKRVTNLREIYHSQQIRQG